MSLYSSVYWTKRVAVVLALIIFFCSGFRLFTYVSKKLTKELKGTVLIPAEAGFVGVDKLTITAFRTPPGFTPQEFVNDTNNGNYDVDNGLVGPEDDPTVKDYPKETEKTPIANVFKIADRQINLNSTEIPRNIAKSLNFNREPFRTTNTLQEWVEGTRHLQIEGQYLTINYSDDIVKNTNFPSFEERTFSGQESIKSYLNDKFKDYGIDTDIEGYEFSAEYTTYDKATNDFIPSSSKDSGPFIRLSAKRVYSNLSKPYSGTKTYAVYPNPQYHYTNNYIIIGKNMQSTTNSDREMTLKMSLYNWPISKTNLQGKDNKDVQTYYIKTPKTAFEELKSSNKTLISAVEWGTNIPKKSEDLVGINRVLVRQIKLEYYEDTVNTSYIQPVYVFLSEVSEGNKHYELVYVIPALLL